MEGGWVGWKWGRRTCSRGEAGVETSFMTSTMHLFYLVFAKALEPSGMQGRVIVFMFLLDLEWIIQEQRII
jgi:hypothetical protein